MVPNWKSDLKLVLGTLVLLLIEVVGLLMHLHWIPNPFQREGAHLSQQPAGFVLNSQRELRKREFNSLVWENSGADDVLHYYDSVLTLSQSSATLHLNEQTEVHLSENTLVTIEPVSAREDNQIRLKFTRGDLRARNPFAATKIQGEEWSLNLNQGSEVSLRQTGDHDFEVEVLKGQLEFEKDSGKKSLAENQVLKIENNQVAETLSVANELSFEGPNFHRIYSFQAKAAVPVSWKGEAEKMQISPLGKGREEQALESLQRQETLQLEPGKYSLRLMKQGQVSLSKDIEIWQAPTLHLLSPFPRDRLKTKESVTFVWSQVPEASEYKWTATDLHSGRIYEQKTLGNSLDFTFQEESDYQWQVIGIDRDGFEMPASYANQVFLRHEPFAAPKLKSPELRAPASPKKKSGPESARPPLRHSLWSWLWQLCISEASAQTAAAVEFEAVFAWEPVPEADLYTIEISATSDFRNPVVSKVVRRTEFVWSKFEAGTYYWRVAAGSSQGRMGVFSEPAKAQLQKTIGTNEGVLVREKKNLLLEKQREPVETQSEKILSDTPQNTFDEDHFAEKVRLTSDEQRELKETFLLEWTPLSTFWNLNGEDQLKANLSGVTTGAGHFQTEQIFGASSAKSYLVDISYAQSRWRPKDPTDYPFQSDQSVIDARAMILLGQSDNGLLRGGLVQTVPWIERKEREELRIHTAWAIGPSVYYIWKNSERWKSGHSLGLVAGSEIFALSTQNRFRYQFFKTESSAVSVGFQLQVDLVFHKRSFSSGFGSGLTLGFEH